MKRSINLLLVIYVCWLFFYNICFVHRIFLLLLIFIWFTLSTGKYIIHATLLRYMFSRFKHLLSEGYLYSIKNIKFVASKDSYRPLSHGFKLMFLRTTNPKKLEKGVTNIPLHKFEFIRPDMIIVCFN